MILHTLIGLAVLLRDSIYYSKRPNTRHSNTGYIQKPDIYLCLVFEWLTDHLVVAIQKPEKN
jgi:hypothetical protein